ncbi:unnamed protein product [Chrysoparadoxa australica]
MLSLATMGLLWSATAALGSAAPAQPLALRAPLLVMITPEGCGSQDHDALASQVKLAVEGGASLVQLRDSTSPAHLKASLAVKLREVTKGRAMFMINGDPNLARKCGADGVHLPETMVTEAPELLQWTVQENAADDNQAQKKEEKCFMLLGSSVHSVEAALKAASLGCQYLQALLASSYHPGKIPEGLVLLSAIREALNRAGLCDVALVGVGGINESNCGAVVTEGEGDGIAVIRALTEAEDPAAVAWAMLRQMSQS